MRSKPIAVGVFVLVIIAIALFALRKNSMEFKAKDHSTLYPTNHTGGDTTSDKNNKKDNWNTSGFNYIKEKVDNGTLRGVVEVGASGFNSFVINMDKQKHWEIVSKDFGRSFVYEGLATTEDIRAGLTKYRAAMRNKGVDEKNMHFVISSGAQKEPKTAVIIKELRILGFLVNTVTPAQEARYALKATLPTTYYDNSFMVDLGSGNTKISWDEEGTLKSMELPGSRYHERGTTDAAVYDQSKEKISKLPPEKGDVCFIIGGIPHALAAQHRKGDERYTVLKAPHDYTPSDKKMASGLNIYRAIVEGTNTDTFVFDWEANFSIGFLLSME